jgi:hypothetical protein
MDRAACPRCRRKLGEGEPVYQIFRSLHVCAECQKEIEGGGPHPSSFWRAAKPCINCGRPVLNMAKRKEPEIIACGYQCRNRIHNARKKTVALRPCASAASPSCQRKGSHATARRSAESGPIDRSRNGQSSDTGSMC